MKRRIYLSMKSVAEARELWLSRFEVDALATAEEVPVTAAHGRVTAAPVMALRSSPAAHQAAMDGFPSTPATSCPRGPMR
jgi:molybdopterin biosynthesis enzyme